MSINRNRPSQTGNFSPSNRGVSATRLNRMGQFIDQARPGIHSGNAMPSETPGGTLININQARARPASNKHPFKIVVKSATKIGVIVGTVNGMVPKMDSKSLDDDTPPELAVTATSYIYIKATGSGQQIGYVFPQQPCEVIKSTTQKNDTDDIGYIAVGKVTVAQNKITKVEQYVTNSLWVERLKCGSNPAAYYWSAV